MGAVNPFTCSPGDTVNINVSSSSQVIQIAADGNPRPVRITNDGSATVWINWGGSGVTATTSNLPIEPGNTEVLTMWGVGAPVVYVAAIAVGPTGKIYFTPGSDGI